MSELAIIIPAYKSIFFHKTLSSLANQTNKNFTVYIGDDCSPEDIISIVDLYRDRLNIHYTRYSKNIGAKRIVDQWNRCVKLALTEDWIWLFSDDDIMDPNCVETFYKYLNVNPKSHAFRFNVNRINSDEKIIKEINKLTKESCEDLIENILTLNGGHGLVDHIFNINTLRENGGFVYTEYAQGADWATSILMAVPNGLINMKEASVYWRMSIYNISSQASSNNKNAMLKGHIQFLNWVHDFYINSLYFKQNKSQLSEQKLADLLRFNFEQVVNMHYKGITLSNIIKYQRKLSKLFCFTKIHNLRYLIKLFIINNRKALFLFNLTKQLTKI